MHELARLVKVGGERPVRTATFAARVASSWAKRLVVAAASAVGGQCSTDWNRVRAAAKPTA
jgi:hypothetical protein